MAFSLSVKPVLPGLVFGLLLAPLPVAGQAGQGEEAKPVAVILGKPVYEEDLGPPGERERRFEGMLWTAVFEDYARSRDVRPTAAEIDSLYEDLERTAQESAARWREQAVSLRRELDSPDLDAERRAAIEVNLRMLEGLIASEDRVAELRQEEGEVEETVRSAESRRVAEQWARRWKLNQALFREYGGHVIFQQAGLEPLDAFRELLEDYAERGAFTIHDPVLEKAAWRYFEQGFTTLSEEEGRFYFEKPPWLRTPEEMKAAGFGTDE